MEGREPNRWWMYYRARTVVQKHVEDRLAHSIERIKRINEGLDCACQMCAYDATYDANSWVGFIAKGNQKFLEDYSFDVQTRNDGEEFRIVRRSDAQEE